MIPFGCLIYYVPSPTRDDRDKAEPAMRSGVFVGYTLPPGGKCEGGDVVVDLGAFNQLPLHAEAEARFFQACQPHITRTVKRTPHGVHFPLFQRYVEQNETIEGVEEALNLMQRERRRRRRMRLPQ